jgi:hypothetical protein
MIPRIARIDAFQMDILSERVLELGHRPGNARWITRRGDVLTLEHERSVRHEMSIDVNLRHIGYWRLPSRPAERSTVLVPIHRLPRANHVMFDVSSHGLGDLERATWREERDIVCRALTRKWRPRISVSALDCLMKIVREQPRDKWRDTPDSVVPPLPVEHSLALTRALVDGRPELLGNAEFIAVTKELLTDAARWFHQFLVIVELPRSSARQNSILIRLGYVEPLPRRRLPLARKPVGVAKDPFRRKIARWTKNTLHVFGKLVAGSYSFTVRVPVRSSIGCAQGTHISMTAPAGLRTIDSVVMVDYGAEGPRKRVVYPSDDLLAEQAHIYIGERSIRVHHAEFRTSLYAYKTGFPVQAMVLSWILAALASVTYWRASSASFSSTFLTTLEQNSTTILLIVVPVVVAVITQTDGHRATSTCFQTPRILLSISAVAILGTAGLIAFSATGAIAEWGFRSALIVSGVVAVRLTSSFFNQWIRTTPRHARAFRTGALAGMDLQLMELAAFELAEGVSSQ